MPPTTELHCACGTVRLEVQGAPIFTSECHCHSCRMAAARIEALPSAPTFRAPNGGTPFVLYRKDRVRFLAGVESLRSLWLAPKRPTRRLVASCCNTPIFLEFKGGHWLSLYACLWSPEQRPAMRLRTMLSDLPEGVTLDAEVPGAQHQSLGFMTSLLGAWIRMGFRRPVIDVGPEPLPLPANDAA